MPGWRLILRIGISGWYWRLPQRNNRETDSKPLRWLRVQLMEHLHPLLSDILGQSVVSDAKCQHPSNRDSCVECHNQFYDYDHDCNDNFDLLFGNHK